MDTSIWLLGTPIAMTSCGSHIHIRRWHMTRKLMSGLMGLLVMAALATQAAAVDFVWPVSGRVTAIIVFQFFNGCDNGLCDLFRQFLDGCPSVCHRSISLRQVVWLSVPIPRSGFYLTIQLEGSASGGGVSQSISGSLRSGCSGHLRCL